MPFKELFKKYKIYTIVGIIVLLLLAAGGITAGVLLTKQDKEQINDVANAAVGDEFTVGDLIFSILTEGTTNTVEVGDTTSTSISGEIEIPSQVSYGGITYTVTEIGYQAFYNCSSLTELTIPDSVTSIGSYAFRNCSSLTELTIPDSVTSIGSSAFGSCSSLTKINFNSTVMNDLSSNDDVFYNAGKDGTGIIVNIGESVTKIPAYLFYAGSSSYTAPKIVTVNFAENSQCESIGNDAFYYCDDLTEITIPDGVTSIGSSAFRNCNSLTSIAIPNSVTSIGNYAFYSCSSLTNVYFTGDIDSWVGINFDGTYANPLYYADYLYIDGQTETPISGAIIIDTATTIGNYALYNQDIISVTIGNQVTSISERAFSSTNLTEVTIPNSVTSIGEYAFGACNNLSTVTLGNGLTSIGQYAFNNTEWLTSIKNNNNNGQAQSSDGTKNYLIQAPNTSITNYDLTGVDVIADGAFYNCSSLINIELPEDIPSLGSYTFYNCSSLTDVTIPENVTSIGEYAFYNCSGLTSITIPESITNIGNSAFSGCTGLTEINFNATNMNDLSSSNRVFYQAGQDGAGIIVNIGANVTKIPARLFYPFGSNSTAPKIVTVNFAENSQCESIGNYAFYYCESITNVYYAGDINDWVNINFDSNYANPLYYAENLYLEGDISTPVISINIDTATTIRSYSFAGWTGLQSVTIGNQITNIENHAFSGCTALTEINFNATNMNDLSSHNNVFSYAGQDGAGITVNIGANVTRIPAYLFYPGSSSYAPYITAINFAENSQCESMGDYAFSGCTALTEINFNATNMNDLSSSNNVFSYAGQDGAGITVNIGANVTKIPAYLFYPYYNNSRSPYITAANFADGSQCNEIGSSAFRYCDDLTSITIPDSVTSIEDYAFSGSALTSITIPNSVISIGSSAFSNCSSLGTVSIGSGVTSIGNRALFDCSSLSNINVDINNNYYSSIDGVLFNKIQDTIIQYPMNKPTATYIVPDSVTTINNEAFYNCSYLENITLPEGLTAISEYAFYGCTGLVEITIPRDVIGLGDYAFYNCTALTEINFNATYLDDLNEGVFYNANYVFYNAGQNSTGITVNIGANVTRIPSCLFYPHSSSSYSPYIIAVNFAENSQCTSIGDRAFYYCDDLTNIIIPDSVMSIGEYVFCYCDGLNSVIIGGGVMSIGDGAFNYCRSLNNVYFYNPIQNSSSDAYIGTYAFRNNASTVTYWVIDQTSLTNIQAIYNNSTSKFSANNFRMMPFNIYAAVASNSIGMGTVSGGGDGVYLPVTLTAAPNEDCVIVGWSLNSDGSNIIAGSEGLASYTVTTAGNYTYYAVFENLFYVTIVANEDIGTVYVNGEDVSNTTIRVSNQDSVVLMALPKLGCTALGWEITTSSGTTYNYTDNPFSIIITEDTTITAILSSDIIEGVGVGVTAIGGGQVRMGGYIDDGDTSTTVVLNAICYKGYTFDGWYTMENGVLTKIDALGNFTAVTINVADYDGKLIIARFIPNSNGNVNEDTNN